MTLSPDEGAVFLSITCSHRSLKVFPHGYARGLCFRSRYSYFCLNCFIIGEWLLSCFRPRYFCVCLNGFIIGKWLLSAQCGQGFSGLQTSLREEGKGKLLAYAMTRVTAQQIEKSTECSSKLRKSLWISAWRAIWVRWWGSAEGTRSSADGASFAKGSRETRTKWNTSENDIVEKMREMLLSSSTT